ncbi:MAG: glycosyltransferase family 4 protein [Pirellulales bacterium]|nr:glycosyltransferase family 4 protein [Pirellulales bacterium]
MHIILNTSTLFKGGALQTSTAFILQALADPAGIQWQFILSAESARQVTRFRPLPPQTDVFNRSPARHRPSRRRLAELVAQSRPDLVFTFSGPAYVKFPTPHAVGVTDGWVTHSTWTAYRSVRFPREWLFFALNSLYKIYWYRKANQWFVQTELARRGLHRRARIPLERIVVVPNTCGEHYRAATVASRFPGPTEKLRLLSFSASYSHKNLILLPDIASQLQRIEPALDFEMVVTLPPEDALLERINRRAARLGVERRMVNRGPIPVVEGPDLYRSCHVCLLPTHIETYSATYAESMSMGLPIVTTDLNFAHDACRDAALYFQPRNAVAAAEQIQRLIHDPALRQQLVARGRQIVSELPTPRQRYEMYVAALKRLASES